MEVSYVVVSTLPTSMDCIVSSNIVFACSFCALCLLGLFLLTSLLEEYTELHILASTSRWLTTVNLKEDQAKKWALDRGCVDVASLGQI